MMTSSLADKCLLLQSSGSSKPSATTYLTTQNATLYYVSAGSSEQGCINPGHQVAKVIKICTMALNICAFSQWNLLYVTLLVPRILRRLLDFWKICIPMALTSISNMILKIDFDHMPY